MLRTVHLLDYERDLLKLNAWLSPDGKLYPVRARQHILDANEIIEQLDIPNPDGIKAGDIVLQLKRWIKIHDGVPVRTEEIPTATAQQYKVIRQIEKILRQDSNGYQNALRRLSHFYGMKPEQWGLAEAMFLRWRGRPGYHPGD